jgi:DNA repair exonuclease SbcCD nuclease subunit
MAANEAAFASLVALAGREHVDALLIAGDMFDTPRADGEILEWAAGQLGSLECPVVILPGNHDWFEDQSPFLRFDFEERCPNAHVLDKPDGELVILEELGAAFFGRPVRDHHPSFRPLADIPARPHDGWCVVMGHGLVVTTDRPTHRGSPIYPRDLAAIDWDYVALGHWGRHWQVQTDPVPVVYAGDTARSLEGRPGAVLVDLDPRTGVTPAWAAL